MNDDVRAVLNSIGLLMPLTLRVVFFAGDVPRGPILGIVNLRPFFLGHHPIRLGLIFHVGYMILLLIQPGPLLGLPLGRKTAFRNRSNPYPVCP